MEVVMAVKALGGLEEEEAVARRTWTCQPHRIFRVALLWLAEAEAGAGITVAMLEEAVLQWMVTEAAREGLSLLAVQLGSMGL